jgi:SAM-dependent methyltransferase
MSGFDPAYLAAKEAVDSRSYNTRVWSRFTEELLRWNSPKRIIDLGAGTGTLLSRLLSIQGLGDFLYAPLDADGRLLAILENRLDRPLLAERRISVAPIRSSLEEFLSAPGEKWDLCVSNAFLDLLDIPRHIGPILERVASGGLLYCAAVFDGVTLLLPEGDPDFGAAAAEAYHRSMDGGSRSGSRAGKVLLRELLERHVRVLESGPSDWAIVPIGGEYRPGERDFLKGILSFFSGALAADETIDQGKSAEWLREKSLRLEAGELAFFTHQWDLLCRKE